MADHVCEFTDLGGQKCCRCGAWKPPTGPVTDPSKERIAAALALAEACHPYDDARYNQALDAYRATLPEPAKVYEWSRVPPELWAALAHECCAEDRWVDMRPELLAAIHAIQHAADERVPTLPRLRSRAEVDAEKLVHLDAWVRGTCDCTWLRKQCEKLSAEPTTDYGPGSVDDSASPPVPEPAAGATSSEPCSCDEALELQRIIRIVQGLARDLNMATEGVE